MGKRGKTVQVTFLKRNLLQRILGVPATPRTQDPGGWAFSGEKLVIDLKRTTQLEKPGDALRFEGRGLPDRVLVVLGEDGAYHAFRNRCTHLGHRRLDPVPGTQTLQCCSVSKSTYDLEGKRIYGPAPRPITAYAAEREGDKLIVTLS